MLRKRDNFIKYIFMLAIVDEPKYLKFNVE